MREIKFRAWSKKEKKFIVDYNRILPAHYDYPIENGGLEPPHLCVYVPELLYIDDCILMLATGLKDKNGKEIYEGDIVKPGYGQEIAEIICHNGMFLSKSPKESIEDIYETYEECMTFLVPSRTEDMEVIGNIYENQNYWEKIDD